MAVNCVEISPRFVAVVEAVFIWKSGSFFSCILCGMHSKLRILSLIKEHVCLGVRLSAVLPKIGWVISAKLPSFQLILAEKKPWLMRIPEHSKTHSFYRLSARVAFSRSSICLSLSLLSSSSFPTAPCFRLFLIPPLLRFF